MNGAFAAWWRSRTLREQRLLLTMFGLMALVLCWLLIIRPLDDALARARERHGEAVAALTAARGQIETISGLKSQGSPAVDAPLETMINNAAVEAGFPVSQVTRDGAAQATISLGAVRPQAFFAWIQQMEARGLIVDRMTTTINADATLAAQVTFRLRGN